MKIAIRWEYIPFVGMLITFPAHWKAVAAYRKSDPRDLKTGARHEATWEAGSKCMTAILCTVIPALVAVVLWAVVFGR
jgi:hypothetical protein